MTNLDEPFLRFPFGGTLAKRWCVGAALLGTMVAIMLPVRAEALSCRWPQQFYFFECEEGRCLPMFRTDFAPSYGCAGRTVLESIEPWEFDTLSAEIDRRGLEPDGVLGVSVSGRRLFPPEHELEHSLQLELATMTAVAEPAQAVRRSWKQKARAQLWAVVILRLPVWTVFFVLLLVCGLGARSVWRTTTGQTAVRGTKISRAIVPQAIVVAIGACAFLMLDDGYGVYLGLWPIALAGAIALLLLVAELAAIGVKRVRNRTSE
jgi:hypothetical protein